MRNKKKSKLSLHKQKVHTISQPCQINIQQEPFSPPLSHQQTTQKPFGMLEAYLNSKNIKASTNPYSKQKVANFFFKKFKGTHIPIDYQPSFQFCQKWQSKVKENQIGHNFILHNNPFVNFAFLILMVSRLVLLWYLSMNRLFEFTKKMIIPELSLGLLVVQVGLELYLITQKLEKQNIPRYTQIQWLKIVSRQFLSSFFVGSWIIYLLVSLDSSTHFMEVILDIICIYLNWKKISNSYSHLSLVFIPQKYRNYNKICDFLFNIFVILHFFAIMLYLITKADYQEN